MVTVIFKNIGIKSLFEKVLNKPFFENALNFIKNNKIIVRTVSASLAGLSAVVISVGATGITLGLDVKYLGKTIATVQSAEVFENAKNMAVKDVNSEGADGAISSPKFVLKVTVADKLDNPRQVADAIIENTGDIVLASALVVNGETIGCTESNELSSVLEARKNAFVIEGAENDAQFVDNVEINQGYYLKSDLKEIGYFTEKINSLDVKTVSTWLHDTQIPFKTQKIKTDTQVLGYYKVTTSGKNGISRQKEVIEKINGEEVSREVLSSEVVSAPVTQVITVGTAPAMISATERANITSAGFICPISKGKFVVSSYWGDGRNHKAIDLAANRGVAIFAAASGTVTYAGYNGNYGYTVTIDHGNGMQTRYAHASALCVSRGQSVSQGDMIATVGSTGQSTGNHLHFEVIVNGVRVNPAPYIGL